MVETRRGSSSSSKRPLSSSPPSKTKRSKVSKDVPSTSLPSPPVNESEQPQLHPPDLQQTASLKPEGVCDGDKSPSSPIEDETLVSPQCLGIKSPTFSLFLLVLLFWFLCMHVVFLLVKFMDFFYNQMKLQRNQKLFRMRQRCLVGQRNGPRNRVLRLCGGSFFLSFLRILTYP